MESVFPTVRNSIGQLTGRVHLELLRYFLASAGALTVDAGSLYLLTEYLGIHYLVSAAIGFLLGMAAIYLLSIGWVFSTRRVRKTHHEMVIFALIGVVGLAINEAGLYLLTEYASLHYMISKFLVSFLVFSWNFVARKLILFR